MDGEFGFRELSFPLALFDGNVSNDSMNLGAPIIGFGLPKFDDDPFLLVDRGRVVVELAPDAVEARDDADGIDEAK